MKKFAAHPVVAALLRAVGVDPVQYSLLLELFSTLSRRQEFEVGQARVSMRVAVGMYALISAVINLVAAFGPRPPIRSFVFFNLVFTGFLLLMTLVLESINTFLNPVEASVLSHHPIRDKSYFAAKLTYLAAFVGEIVFPVNAAPALLGLNLKDASWLHPVTFLLAAYLLGLFVALIACGVLGILFRVVPAARVRNSIMWIQIVFFMLLGGGGPLLSATRRIRPEINFFDSAALPLNWFVALGAPAQETARLLFAWPAWISMAVCAVFIVFGIQSLSNGYMSRVQILLRSGPSRQRARGGLLGDAVRLITGKPSGRGAFAFVNAMARTDWQFRRTAYPMMIQFLIFPLLGFFRTGLGHSPFMPGPPTAAQLLPHIGGVVGLLISLMITYSNQHRAAWIFLTFPSDGISSFVRGIFWALWIPLAVLPLLALPLEVWSWGIGDAALFTVYSLAVGSFYLSVELFLIDALPFTNPPEAQKGTMSAPLIIGGLIVAVILVGLQWLFIFQSRLVTAGTVLVFAGSAYLISQTSLRYLETNVLHSLHVIATGRSGMFKEVN